jgi:hypothetical protein
MDLNTLDCLSSDEAYPVDIVLPDNRTVLTDDDGEPVQIFLLPPDCEKLEKRRAKLNDWLAAARREKAGVTDAKWEHYRISEAAIIVDGWSDNLVLDGEAVAYSETEAFRLMQRFPYLRRTIAGAGKNESICWASSFAQRVNGDSGAADSIDETPKPASAGKTNSARSKKAGSKASGK